MSFIFLTGMPGAGKTYWGRLISAAYHLPFTDLDEYIEAAEKKPVSEIFALAGEHAFRHKESAALAEIIQKNEGGVLATGGGTVIDEKNRLLMRAHGCIVYLQNTIETLVARLKGETDKRPLLTNTPYLLPTLQQMLSARETFYEQAHYILTAENLSVATFAEIIEACINRRL